MFLMYLAASLRERKFDLSTSKKFGHLKNVLLEVKNSHSGLTWKESLSGKEEEGEGSGS